MSKIFGVWGPFNVHQSGPTLGLLSLRCELLELIIVVQRGRTGPLRSFVESGLPWPPSPRPSSGPLPAGQGRPCEEPWRGAPAPAAAASRGAPGPRGPARASCCARHARRGCLERGPRVPVLGGRGCALEARASRSGSGGVLCHGAPPATDVGRAAGVGPVHVP